MHYLNVSPRAGLREALEEQLNLFLAEPSTGVPNGKVNEDVLAVTPVWSLEYIYALFFDWNIVDDRIFLLGRLV